MFRELEILKQPVYLLLYAQIIIVLQQSRFGFFTEILGTQAVPPMDALSLSLSLSLSLCHAESLFLAPSLTLSLCLSLSHSNVFSLLCSLSLSELESVGKATLNKA